MPRMIKIQHTAKAAPRGFSIMEIIVTAAIIGVLVLIMTPVLTSRAREAKIRAAESDLEHLADAQERAAIQTGYMYRLYVLDDTLGGNAFSNEQPSKDPLDGILDEKFNKFLGGAVPVPAQATRFFIDTTTQAIAGASFNLYTQLASSPPNSESAFGWAGPYINWHRDANDNDWPDDPWGVDYLLFTRAGALSPYETDFVLLDLHVTNAGRTGIMAGFTNIFDRPTLLSLGPNGLPGDGSGSLYGTGDDITRSF